VLVASLLRATALRHELERHLRGVHRGLSRLCRQQVLDPSHDDTPEPTALVTELRPLFETDALGLALGEKLFVERVRNLDALFFKRKRAQITTPRGFTPLLLVVGLARVVRLLEEQNLYRVASFAEEHEERTASRRARHALLRRFAFSVTSVSGLPAVNDITFAMGNGAGSGRSRHRATTSRRSR